MCFTRKSVALETAKIAVKDIITYKIFRKHPNGYYISPSRNYKWQADKELKAPLKRVLDKYDVYIHKGFHSIKTLRDAKAYNSYHFTFSKCSILKVTIPKGSIYWENDTQIVSDTMILPSTSIASLEKPVKKVVKPAKKTMAKKKK